MEAIIAKKDLKRLMEAARKHAVVYMPVNRDGDVGLAEAGPGDEISFEYSNFNLPVKREVFPWCEVLFEYENGHAKKVSMSEEKKVIFGVRPCDAASLLMLDSVFLKSPAQGLDTERTYDDPYYRARREATLFITLGCNSPEQTCFCTSVDGGPFSEKGADIMACDVGDTILFNTVTEKGEAFLTEHQSLFGKPSSDHLQQRNERKGAAEKKITETKIAGISEALERSEESALWKEISERCLSCGVCTYLCPTCHCFAFQDEVGNGKQTKKRIQDACMFPFFTLEASGHNPRPRKEYRLRQRIMHKFRYTQENYNRLFCVGCGRCITNCPVNIDIREIARKVNT
ncbi:MAG: 4Fe-4S dicluster domain-containing protein [Chitinispirillaceae bacterium]|nr:4Fe-4S dicluster domain-containing protein [Chitinispirillaceae bacterium]